MSGTRASSAGAGGSRSSSARRAASVPSLAAGASSNYASSSYPADDPQLQKRYQAALGARGGSLPQAHARNRDKVVSLLEAGQLPAWGEEVEEEAPLLPGDALPRDATAAPWEVQPPVASARRIAIHCTASAYDLKGLRQHLEQAGYRCSEYPEVLHTRFIERSGEATGDIFFFGWGAVVFWALSSQQEAAILWGTLKRFEQGPLARGKVESDTFQFRLGQQASASIQNDIITLASGMRDAHLVKLSISFALSQSTKLTVIEERVARLAILTRSLPEALAKEGKVKIGDREIAKLMGRVFLEQAGLNLLGSILDTPEFFYDQADFLQHIYDKVWDYLEMDDRIEILNTRLQVLHELLNMLRQQQHALHSDALEWVIIILIVIDVVVLLFQLAATLGWIGPTGGGLPHGLQRVDQW